MGIGIAWDSSFGWTEAVLAVIVLVVIAGIVFACVHHHK